MTRRKHSCVVFSFPIAFLLFLFCLVFNKHPGLVSWGRSFSSTCVKFKSGEHRPETAWHPYSFSALGVAGPCCFHPFPAMKLQAVISTGDRSCLLWFCCCFFVVVAAPACLHLIFVCRDIGWDIITAPELFQFVAMNIVALHFSHTREKRLLTSLMPSKRLSD